jgi:transposase
VSVSSISRFLTRWRKTGSVSPEKFGGYKGYALERYRSRIARWVDARPDITLSELRGRLSKEKVVVSQTAIFRFLRHLGFLKKKACTRPNKIGRTWPPPVGWLKMQTNLDARRLVFIDETAASTNMTRRYGRGARGERLVCKVPRGSLQPRPQPDRAVFLQAQSILAQAACSIQSLWRVIRSCLVDFSPRECAAYLANAGYGQPYRKVL